VAEEGDDLGDSVDHLGGVGLLAGVTVDGEGQVEVVGVGQGIGGEKVWAHRAESVGPLSVEPVVEVVPVAWGAIFCEGNGAGGDVVGDGVACDAVVSLLWLDVFRVFADDDGELDFVVDGFAVGGPGDLISGAYDDGGGHQERAWDGCALGGFCQAEFESGLLYVLGVVSGEGEDFAGAWDGCEEPDVAQWYGRHG